MEITERNFKKALSKNSILSLIFELLNLLFSFVERYVLIKQLGNSYLSLNGLFQNIISIISFADLGVGTVMTFFLYEYIARNDVNKINSLSAFYRKIYLWIALVICLAGAVFAPFIHFLVDDTIAIKENIYLIFFLFVGNSAVSYLFCSFRTFLIANQQSYIVNIISHISHVCFSILQIVVLILTKNYILYLLLRISSTVVIDLAAAFYVKIKYPYIVFTNSAPLPEEQKKLFWKETGNILIYRLSSALVSGIDNILISLLISSSTIGLTSNYFLIINSINSLLMAVCNSLIGTIGIICATDNNKKDLFQKFSNLNFAISLVFSFCSICIYALSTPFISLLFGNEYILTNDIIFAMVLSFYLTGTNQIVSSFRTSFGLFKEGKFIPSACALLNLGLSILLGKILGLFGIYIATVISKILTFSIFDPFVLFKKKIGMQYLRKYFIEWGYLLLLTLVSMFCTNELIALLSINNLLWLFLVKCFFALLFSTSFLLFGVFPFREFSALKEFISRFLRSIKRKSWHSLYNKTK